MTIINQIDAAVAEAKAASQAPFPGRPALSNVGDMLRAVRAMSGRTPEQEAALVAFESALTDFRQMLRLTAGEPWEADPEVCERLSDAAEHFDLHFRAWDLPAE